MYLKHKKSKKPKNKFLDFIRGSLGIKTDEREVIATSHTLSKLSVGVSLEGSLTNLDPSHPMIRSKIEAIKHFDPSWRRNKTNIRSHEEIRRVLSGSLHEEYMQLIRDLLLICEKLDSWPVMRSGTLLGMFVWPNPTVCFANSTENCDGV